MYPPLPELCNLILLWMWGACRLRLSSKRFDANRAAVPGRKVDKSPSSGAQTASGLLTRKGDLGPAVTKQQAISPVSNSAAFRQAGEKKRFYSRNPDGFRRLPALLLTSAACIIRAVQHIYKVL